MFASLLSGMILGSALAAPASSAELDLRWSTFPDEATQGRMVYLDVLGTAVPPVELVDAAGNRFKLNLKVSLKPSTEEVVIQPFLYAVRQTRKGEKLEPLGDTEVRTTAGSRASVRFGTDGKTPPKAGIELDFRPRLDAGPRIPEMPARPPEPPPEPAPPPAERAAPEPDLDDEFLREDAADGGAGAGAGAAH
jgi:hypothetical protein